MNLTALSREFIVTYELQEDDFKELVAEFPLDFENVCQLRDEILAMKMPEILEGPELTESSLHFVPLRQLVVRRANRSQKQPRKSNRNRRHRRMQSQHHLLDD